MSSASPAPAFFRIRDVVRITALSRPTLYRRIAARRFPPPVHLGGRACGWCSAALQTWINDPEGYCAPAGANAIAPRKRGRPRKVPRVLRGRFLEVRQPLSEPHHSSRGEEHPVDRPTLASSWTAAS